MIFIVRVLANEDLKIIRLLTGLGTFPRNTHRTVNAESDDREKRVSQIGFDRYLRQSVYIERIAVWRLQYLRFVEQSPEEAVRMNGGCRQLIGGRLCVGSEAIGIAAAEQHGAADYQA